MKIIIIPFLEYVVVPFFTYLFRLGKGIFASLYLLWWTIIYLANCLGYSFWHFRKLKWKSFFYYTLYKKFGSYTASRDKNPIKTFKRYYNFDFN